MSRTKSNLLIITGAGFSKPVGLPLASDIEYYFTRDNVSNILSFSSGEKDGLILQMKRNVITVKLA